MLPSADVSIRHLARGSSVLGGTLIRRPCTGWSRDSRRAQGNRHYSYANEGIHQEGEYAHRASNCKYLASEVCDQTSKRDRDHDQSAERQRVES